MKTSKGVQVNTVFGIGSMLINIMKVEEPDALVFCFDDGNETFRHKQYKEYKAGRAETPDDFYSQVPLAFKFLDACHVKRVSLKSHEADDLLCAYAHEAVKHGDRVTIVTGDRDALQLASEKVRIAVPAKGYQQPEYYGPGEVYKKYGVRPDQIPSYKGLVGDSSDNLAGVHGIGPKAAMDLLQKYDSLKGIYENISSIKPAWREKLERDKEQAFFCEKMAELVCDFDLPFSLKEITLKDLPMEDILNVCKEMEFSLVTRRMRDFANTPYGRAHFLPAPDDQKTAQKASSTTESSSSQLSLL